jgi:hypothetical protein
MGDIAHHVGEKRAERAICHRPLEAHMPSKRADPQRAVARDAKVELGNAVDVDQDGWPRQTEVHGRHEALPAREHLGIVAVRRQEFDGLVDRARRVIVEGCWLHGVVRTEPTLP